MNKYFCSKFWDNLWNKTFSRTGFTFNLSGKPYLQYVFQKYFNPTDKLRFLDIGCGVTDNFKSYFNDSNSWLINFDISHSALIELKRRIDIGNIPINYKSNFVQGAALSLPFKDNFFDLVLCCQCLHYFSGENRKVALNEIIRTCKKGGYIIISVKNKYSLQSLFNLLSPRFPLPFHPFTYRELRRGFEHIQIIELFGNIKIPKIDYSLRLSIFLNKRYKKSRLALLFGMDLVLIAKK